MKEFFKWFKSSTRMKRWLFLMLLGIALLCYGLSKLLVTDELEFIELAQIIACFVFGVTFAITSFVCMQKRTLEMLIEESDTRDVKKGDYLDSLIFNKKIYNQGPKVVVIGGGTGLNTVLKGLKQYTDNITAIVTVSDYGAPKESGINPLENIKESLIALASNEEEMSRLLNAKFNFIEGKPNFSDLYFAAMEGAYGEFAKSIEASKDVLNITGRVIPVTLDAVSVCAELQDGTIIESKEKIPEMVNEKISKIERVFLSPTNCRVAPGVIEAIEEAEAIVIGPGSLYTNVIPNLLVAGVSRAIRDSRAFKIYVGNIMTEFGQTDNFSLSDHLKAIIDHAGEGIVDYCIYDTGEIMPEYIRKYNKEGCELVEQDVNKVKELGVKMIQRKLSVIDNGIIRHNSDAIATSIIQLICDDLRFNDMQNNAQFIRLDSKVKDTSKKMKHDLDQNEIRSGYKKSRRKNKKKSKFFAKYNERIVSIRESEMKPKKVKKTSNVRKEASNKSTENLLKNKPDVYDTLKQSMSQPSAQQESKKIPTKIEKPIQESKDQVDEKRRYHTNREKHEAEHKKEQQPTKQKKSLKSKSPGKHSKQKDIVNDQDFRNLLDQMITKKK